MAMTTHVLIGGTNDGRRLTFQGTSVQVTVLEAQVPGGTCWGAVESDRPVRTEIYRLAIIGTGPRDDVVLCLHESLNVHDGLLRLLDGYQRETEN